MTATKKIKVYRVDPTTKLRVAWVLELDDQRTVVNEYEETIPIGTSRGEETPSRRKENAMTRWTVKEIADNPIPGTDELRAKYLTEVDAVNAAYARKGVSCPGCKIGGIIRRYKDILRAGNHLDAVE